MQLSLPTDLIYTLSWRVKSAGNIQQPSSQHHQPRTAVDLIGDILQHIGQAIQSPQDTVARHFAYLESLVNILNISDSQDSTEQHGHGLQPVLMTNSDVGTVGMNYEDPPSQASALADDIGAQNDVMLSTAGDFSQNLHMQSLANPLDGHLYWEMPSVNG
ncbi:hypothetical protein N7463_002027 [Penicillium fimorum]|uniref:Uncharacterized protein n=1 Tax=Penicillium fimorum TaxID=1882269 RepID=A0A9W9XZN8_9EURO|nr:hypothetical protein N7463_002027 [Penicillium fimorum]